MKASQSAPSAPGLENGLAMLEALLASQEPLGFNALAAPLSVSKPSASRLLKVLLARGWVVKDAASGKYKAGSLTANHAESAGDTLGRLRREAEPELAGLARATGNTALAIYWNGRQMLWLAKRASEQAPSMQDVGAVHQDLGPYPFGWLLYQHLDEAGRKQALALMDDPAAFKRELNRRLETAKKLGCAYDREEIRPGYRRLAALVFGAQGRPVGALALGCTRATLPDRQVAQTARLLVEAAQRVSKSLMGRA